MGTGSAREKLQFPKVGSFVAFLVSIDCLVSALLLASGSRTCQVGLPQRLSQSQLPTCTPGDRHASHRCRQITYSEDLPQISVVFIFVNEALSVILRSVHSVVNHTPSQLLKEVILVDDNSDNGEWQALMPSGRCCQAHGFAAVDQLLGVRVPVAVPANGF